MKKEQRAFGMLSVFPLYLATSCYSGGAVREHVRDNLKPHTEAGREQRGSCVLPPPPAQGNGRHGRTMVLACLQNAQEP